jgi:CRP/FNR family transcriptional regulator, cyclic AMP receptor protein
MNHESALAAHPFCAGLDESQVKMLHGLTTRVHFEAGQSILSEGLEADHLYLIERGQVALEIHTPDRGLLRVGLLGDGEVLGWSWMMPPHRWHLDARAVEPTQALALDAVRLRQRCDADPSLGYELYKRLSAVLLQRLQAVRLQLIDFYSQNC